MSILHRLMLVGVMVAALGAGACATSPEPFEYESHNRTKPGRGAFTGDDGVWTIYRRELPAEPQTEQAEETGGQAENDAADKNQTPTGESVLE